MLFDVNHTGLTLPGCTDIILKYIYGNYFHSVSLSNFATFLIVLSLWFRRYYFFVVFPTFLSELLWSVMHPIALTALTMLCLCCNLILMETQCAANRYAAEFKQIVCLCIMYIYYIHI